MSGISKLRRATILSTFFNREDLLIIAKTLPICIFGINTLKCSGVKLKRLSIFKGKVGVDRIELSSSACKVDVLPLN